MAYNEKLAERVRTLLKRKKGFVAKKMFGGIAFMLRGNMCCGVLNDVLILRLGPDLGLLTLQKPHTQEFNLTGRSLKGMVVVTPRGYATEKSLKKWVDTAVGFVSTLPQK